MVDDIKDGDQNIREAGDSKVKTSDTTTKEASEGMDGQSKSVKDYYQARKGGMRDRFTAEILGDQPQFTDSSKGGDSSTQVIDKASPADSSKTPDSSKAPDGSKTSDGSKAPDGSKDAEEDGKKSWLPDVPKDAFLNRAIARTDQSDLKYDSDNRISQVTDPNGNKTDINYKGNDPVKVTNEKTGETWEKEGNAWNHYDKDHKSEGQLHGTVNVTPEGDIVASGKDGNGKDNFWRQNHDGSTTETNKDKSIVTRDIDGKPTEVIYPDGNRTQVKYDLAGKPEEVTHGNDKYQKDWKDQWAKVDKDGNRTDVDGKFEVDKKTGDISLKRDNDSYSFTRHTDGSTTKHRSDNSEIDADANGRVTKVRYPDGGTNEFQYDKNNEVSKITGGAGDTWTSQGDRWTHKDSNGKEIEPAHLDGKMRVTQQGDIVAVGKDGTFLRQNTDGSFTETQKDKSIVSKDERGNVTDVIYPDGKHSEIKYDEMGKPSEVKLAGEGTYKKGDGDSWSKYDDQGNKVKDVDGVFSVNDNGDITLSRGDKASLTRHTDGSTERHRDDGSEEYSDSNGRPTKVKYPSGHSNEFKYDQDGNRTSITDEKGDTWRRSGDDLVRTDKDGGSLGRVEGGRVNVTKEGDIVVTGKDGYFHRKNHDGSDTSLNEDQSVTTKDEKGNVTEIQYPDGKKNSIGYEGDKAVQIQNNDDSVWLKQGDKWVHYDKNSNEMGSWDGDMKVGKDGTLTIYDKSGAQVSSKSRDGSSAGNKVLNLPTGF